MWAPTVQYFTKLYANCLAFQNKYTWKKLYESAVQVKTRTISSSHGYTNSLTYAYLTTTEQESTFILYLEFLEDQVTALKDDATMASVQTRLPVGGDRSYPPPPKSSQAQAPMMRLLPSLASSTDTVHPKKKSYQRSHSY